MSLELAGLLFALGAGGYFSYKGTQLTGRTVRKLAELTYNNADAIKSVSALIALKPGKVTIQGIKKLREIKKSRNNELAEKYRNIIFNDLQAQRENVSELLSIVEKNKRNAVLVYEAKSFLRKCDLEINSCRNEYSLKNLDKVEVHIKEIYSGLVELESKLIEALQKLVDTNSYNGGDHE